MRENIYLLGSDTPVASCTSNNLYTIDLNAGIVLSRTFYPYARNVQGIEYENLVQYSFDNKRGVLYALNWLPLLPSVNVGTASLSICAKRRDIAAHTMNSAVRPIYQWLLNGNPVGTDDSVYTSNSIANGDSVRCIITTSTDCNIPGPDTSNIIRMQVSQTVYPSIDIHSSAPVTCSGYPVVLTAIANQGGDSAIYKWQVDGTDTVSGSDTFVSISLHDNDTVNCLLISSLACSEPVLSNSIVTEVKMTPVVFAGNDTVLVPTQTVQFHPSTTGTIISYLWTPSNYLDNPAIADPVFTAGASTSYQLLATDINGCIGKGALAITVYTPLHMPAFSPNNDGLNDVFRIPPSNPETIKSFAIYNRWGQLIFKTSDSGSGWDGTFNHQRQPAGTYVWLIEYEDLIRKKLMNASGTVILIR